MPNTALVLRHLHFEDLGCFAEVLEETGYAVRYCDVGEPDFVRSDPLQPDLLVVLGGPIGVYEDHLYPFLAREREFIRTRLTANLPILGICLGAQLIASALGEKVFPTGLKEIGFARLSLTEMGMTSPLNHLTDIPVLHWHGDTYGLPIGAVNLASSAQVEQQAFSLGPSVLGLQFHPEASLDERFERWLVGHAHELAAGGIDISALRRDAEEFGPRLRAAAMLMFRDWLAGLAPRP
ncbi:glutamine amidotransferase [Rhizobium metallidurans]|uniref:GMP synthase (Glutamine-hydrolyzing) n=1 Tax=Rhizobium metallidurans TaxID=1265931 RepID=A0A7W6CTU5_9HYPH|nr:glutamine amidotransferase [Rhizobium metallidurans]MBB3966104.1 GMP synthase (glutamine-hydrolyzing) [Rhizobium metallidurans]